MAGELNLLLKGEDAVILEQKQTEETEFSFPSPLSPFAPVELRGSPVRPRQNEPLGAVGDLHLMKINE